MALEGRGLERRRAGVHGEARVSVRAAARVALVLLAAGGGCARGEARAQRTAPQRALLEAGADVAVAARALVPSDGAVGRDGSTGDAGADGGALRTLPRAMQLTIEGTVTPVLRREHAQAPYVLRVLGRTVRTDGRGAFRASVEAQGPVEVCVELEGGAWHTPYRNRCARVEPTVGQTVYRVQLRPVDPCEECIE